MNVDERRKALSDLVGISAPLPESIAAVREFGWDCEDELVTLWADDIRRVVTSFLTDGMSAADVEAWANAVEVRDDVCFHPAWTLDLVVEMANPDVFGMITKEAMRSVLARVDQHENDQVQALICLVQSFVEQELTASQFASRYLDTFKRAGRIPDGYYAVLNPMFLDCDEYVPDPGLRDEADLDDVTLQARAREAQSRLERLDR